MYELLHAKKLVIYCPQFILNVNQNNTRFYDALGIFEMKDAFIKLEIIASLSLLFYGEIFLF